MSAPRCFLGALAPAADTAVYASWTHELAFGRGLDPERPARPLSMGQAQALLERLAGVHGRESYTLMIRPWTGDRPLGLAQIDRVLPAHGSAMVRLGIGEPAERGQGLGSEALGLLLELAFGRLNLHRVGAVTAATNRPACALLARHGFSVEVRQRAALARGDQREDLLRWGLLRDEWAAGRKEPVGE